MPKSLNQTGSTKLIIIIIGICILLGMAYLALRQVNLWQAHVEGVKNRLGIKNPSQITNTTHSKSFYADLEFDPKNDVILQHSISYASGDYHNYLQEKPESSLKKFIYRIEVVDNNNMLVQEGWDYQYKDLIQTPNATLRFSIFALYSPNSVIRLYSEQNKILWTAKMP